MTPRETRKERREAERRARKIAAKAAATDNNNFSPSPSSPVPAPDTSTPSPNSTAAAAYMAELRAQSDRELEAEFGAEFMAYSREISDRMARRYGLPVSNPTYPQPNHAKRGHEEIASVEPEIAEDEAAHFSELKVQKNEAAYLNEPKPTNNVAPPLTAPKLQTNAPTPHPTPKTPGHSTGPRTAAGKLASSRNSLKHGLASGALTIPGEDTAAFEALRDALLAEHQPADTTEHMLVLELAQSYWLQQRAIRFQNECFTATSLDNKIAVDEKRLALFLRYGTTHERAFHKALNTLLRLKRDRQKAELAAARAGTHGSVSQTISSNGFVSQNDPPPPAKPSPTGFVSQMDASPEPDFTQLAEITSRKSPAWFGKLPDAA